MREGSVFTYTAAMHESGDECTIGRKYVVLEVFGDCPYFLDDNGEQTYLYVWQRRLAPVSYTRLSRKAWVFARRGLRRQLTDCQLALATATRREAIKSRELVDLEAERDEWIEDAHSMARCAAELAMANTLQSIATAEHIVTPAVVEENQKILAENKRVLAQAQEMFSHNAQVHFEHMRSNSKKGPLKWLN